MTIRIQAQNMLQALIVYSGILIIIITLAILNFFKNWPTDEIGVIFQIVGFIFFLPFIQNKWADFQLHKIDSNKHKKYVKQHKQFYKNSLKIKGIFFILLGLIMQFSFFNSE